MFRHQLEFQSLADVQSANDLEISGVNDTKASKLTAELVHERVRCTGSATRNCMINEISCFPRRRKLIKSSYYFIWQFVERIGSP